VTIDKGLALEVTFSGEPMSKYAMKDLIPTEQIERAIFLIRGHKVILDTDLARLYGVTTKRLNEQGKRNRERFPSSLLTNYTCPNLNWGTTPRSSVQPA
jgi:hypothetical protein